MTDGEGRDEDDHGSGHAEVYIPCEAERPTRLCSMGSPREHTIHQSHQDSLVRQAPASVVFLLCRLGLMVGVAVTKLGPLIATGMMPSLLPSLNLQNYIFHQFCKTFSHYLFRSICCLILSLLSF